MREYENHLNCFVKHWNYSCLCWRYTSYARLDVHGKIPSRKLNHSSPNVLWFEHCLKAKLCVQISVQSKCFFRVIVRTKWLANHCHLHILCTCMSEWVYVLVWSEQFFVLAVVAFNQFSSTHFYWLFWQKGIFHCQLFTFFKSNYWISCSYICGMSLVFLWCLTNGMWYFRPSGCSQWIMQLEKQMFAGNDLSPTNCTVINKLPTKQIHTFGIPCQFDWNHCLPALIRFPINGKIFYFLWFWFYAV